MHLYRRILSLPLLAALALAAHAASPAPPASNNAGAILPASQADAINAAITALPRKHDLSATQRKQIEELLRDALNDDQRADAEQTKLQSLRDTPTPSANTPRNSDTNTAGDVTNPLADWRAKLPQQATIAQLSDLLEQERGALTAAQDSIRALDEEVQQQTQRPDALRDELAQAHADADQDAAATPRLPNAPASLAEAARLAAKATQRYKQSHLAALEMEQRTYEARMHTLQNQRSDRRSEVDERSQRVSMMETIVLDRASSAVADIRARLQQTSDQYANGPAPLQHAASANLALGEELVTAVKRLGEVRDLKARYSGQRSETDLAAKNTEDRLKAGGVSEAVGLILLSERRKLQPLPALRRELAELQSELAQAKLRLVDLREEQEGLRGLKPVSMRAPIVAANPPIATSADTPETMGDDLSQLLGTRADLLPRLIGAQSRLVTTLGDTEQQLGGLVSSTTALNTTLNSRLLWTPSHAPINATWDNQFLQTVQQVFSTNHLQSLRDIWQDFSAAGAGFVAALIALLGAAIFAQLRVPALLDRFAAPMRRIRTDRYRCTLNALVLTVLAALPLPLLFWLVGHVLQAARGREPLDNALGVTLISLALPLYALVFLSWLIRETGLAHLHFRWPRARRNALRALLPGLSSIVLITQFVHTVLNLVNTDKIDATFGRAIFILGAFGIAALTWRALRPGAVWSQRGAVQAEPIRLRQLTRGVLSAFFFGCGVLAIAGYYFTAFTLVERMLQSFGAALAVSVLHGLAVRWLMLGERRLALKRMEERLAEEQRNAQANAKPDAVNAEVLPDVEEVETTIASLGEQTRRVVRVLTLLLLTMLLSVIWSDVAPALSFLDTVSIWKATHLTEGKTIVDFSLTLRAVLLSFVVLSLTWVATRNLPGLLEIGVLRRLNVDAPTRYAITSLLRYFIVLFGVIVGIGFLGVQWASLQWLAAGLTVGLGFGLQEIFANFVSGLIVLFERPFRIGDVITVANVEGTVAKIRTRATTIVDWDNREVVVPNKTFITDRLVNWTLSDSITRIVIKVGVAYGSDPAKVQNLLLNLATEHTLVLKDPAPNCWMTAFGDSTLDFELRAFVAEIAQRNRVRTELQFRIKAAFDAAKIDIAFPQMDLWVRNAPPGMAGVDAVSSLNTQTQPVKPAKPV